MSSSIITSIVTGGSNNHSSVSSEGNAYATDFVTQGILGTFTNTNGAAPTTGSFGVNQDASADMGITIKGSGNTGSGAAVAYVLGIPATQDQQVLRARMSADYTGYTINPNSTGSTVYDWIYLSFNATNAETPDAAADNVTNLYTSRSTSNTADNGSPPTYGILLAVVTVSNGASSVVSANIADKRTQAALSVPTTSSSGWTPLGTPLTYGANNGNREFTATAGTNLTGTLSPGMRLQVSRSIVPPSECAALASASSQYAAKASATGLTFTGSFTCEAWIYITSYAASYIINRRNSSFAGGWALSLSAAGQVDILYGASTNATDFQSVQSVPLNRWVHVAGVVTSVASKTGVIYIDGVAVPTTSNFTAATTLVQSADSLAVGAIGGGTLAGSYFNGYLSEVRVWSTNQTAASIQANMTKNLVGSETNLVALYQFNGTWTDATTNANTLTASGGAINTQVANPYNAIEYGIITNVSYSSPTTTITIFTGTQGTLPNQTLNTPEYSIAKTPYGFNASPRLWHVSSILRVNLSQSGTTVNDWYNLGWQLSIPTGEWSTSLTGAPYANRTSSSTNQPLGTLSTSASAQSDQTWTMEIGANPNTDTSATVTLINPMSQVAQSIWYALLGASNSSTNVLDWLGNSSAHVIRATCGYL